MLLAVDVGNSNLVLGLFEGGRLRHTWRWDTVPAATAEDLDEQFHDVPEAAGVKPQAISAAAVASVVPTLDAALSRALKTRFGVEAGFVGSDLQPVLPLRYDPPASLGADRIANAVAGFARFGGPVVIVDFGTATKFEVVSAEGVYRGGLICPGLAMSADALSARTAKLPRVELRRPERLIGSSTVGCLQAGLFFGTLGQVEGILTRLRDELGPDMKVVATGGLAGLIAPASRLISTIDEHLTLEGVHRIWQSTLAKK